MTHSQNVTLVILLAVAALLSVLLIGAYTTQDARAENVMKSGRYVVCTAAYSESRELLYVLDMQTKQLNVYFADIQGRSILPVGKTVDLESARPSGR
ncbi:MAG: hypothetical protein BWX88_00106 [Planctomycetes bacterium ADurb.Bin126]|nr:MAG: hypothetical protein BWX88_00106 [Planctomycetes bacterium ADurb.Bin126]HOD82224.1 hypothetical protein [Phycisphaerae bacterium]HQL74660.1 hypothetical protein [Phycisphaerae bacterium]